jgi:transposase
MSDLTEHYRQLLGLDNAWRVESVDFDPTDLRVSIHVEHIGGPLRCPECGGTCSRADTAPERVWRHLDTMQFRTEIRAAVPRCNCSQCGVKTIAVPWAGKHSRFTLLFEAFAIEVLNACSSISRAAALLKLDWDTVQLIMERAVQRGMTRRSTEGIQNVGMDEKSFGKGHDYITLLTDIDGKRVLEVVEDRTKESADKLWESLPENQRKQVRAVAMDMWTAYMTSAQQHVPEAEIVHDKFHISKYLNEAVDQVRRTENKALRLENDDRLVGSKQLWLFKPANLSRKRRKELDALKKEDLKTSRAWAIKENFRHFWSYVYTSSASDFFEGWYSWAIRSQLKPIVKVAKIFRRHVDGLLSYFRHRITNATSEGFNSRIQAIKSAARGFRDFKNYRTRILFFCGKLDLMPPLKSH